MPVRDNLVRSERTTLLLRVHGLHGEAGQIRLTAQ
jgi:hypothetical protein